MNDIDDDFDPEVRADAQLRESTQRDPTRNRSGSIPEYKRSQFVGAWKCRDCGALVPITDEPMEQVAIFNRELRRRGEPPLDTNRALFCDDCRDTRKQESPERRSAEIERLTAAIREFKALDLEATDPLEQRRRMDELEALGHPDVDGLVRWMQNKANRKTKRVAQGEL